jgi:hypothetical protein
LDEEREARKWQPLQKGSLGRKVRLQGSQGSPMRCQIFSTPATHLREAHVGEELITGQAEACQTLHKHCSQ